MAYLPKAEGRFPVIFQYEPYVGAGTGPWPPSDWWPSDMWLKNGYALVFANVRGTGCSQGVFDFLGPHEGPDGAAIVDWIGEQPWSDRSVGMIGASYPGHTQILVAAEHPEGLKAIAPAAVTASSYSEIFYPGGISNISFISEWGLHLQPSLEAIGVKARIGWGDKECEKNYRAHPANSLFLEARAHPFFDQWWRSRSLEQYISRVNVPTFISGTWQDHQTMASGATELYEQLKSPKRLSMSPRGHVSAYFEAGFQRDLLRWMDRWVKEVRYRGATASHDLLGAQRAVAYRQLDNALPQLASGEDRTADILVDISGYAQHHCAQQLPCGHQGTLLHVPGRSGVGRQ